MKQCPYCNAQIADDSKFCGECGKEYPQGNVCPKCGATVNEGDIYCEICGRNLKDGSYVSGNDSKSSKDYMKMLLSSLIGIIVGIVTLAIIGGSWYGCNEYAAYKERTAAREKFVADSLEQVRKDSIKLVQQKEKERQDSIENARIQALQKPYLDLLDKYDAKGADEHWGEYYFLYDLNGDDFPELWLQVLENEEYKLLIYSNKDGEAKLLFKGDVGHPAHHSFHKGDNYVLIASAHMGEQFIDKYYVDNGVVKQKNIFTLEADSFEEATSNYKEVSEPEISTFEITNKSPIYDLK